MARFETISSITFFFPYREVSGVPNQFSRMARFLSERYGIETRVIDYPDGYMTTVLSDSRVKRIHFNEGKRLRVSSDTILVFQACYPYNIPEELDIDEDCRIVFWVLHPLNIVPAFLVPNFFSKHESVHRIILGTVFKSLTKKVRTLLRDMATCNSLIYMDGATWSFTTNRLGIDRGDPIFVPVPSDNVERNIALERLLGFVSGIHVCWIGRLCDFKVYILNHLLERLSRYASRQRQRITMHVIGSGSMEGVIQDTNYAQEYFNVKMLGRMPQADVDHYLIQHIHIAASMGTAALESAKLGIPTILLDFSYGKLKNDYVFHWIHEQRDYTLGNVITAKMLKKGNDSLEKMLGGLERQYVDISAQTYSYYKKNHSLEIVGARFVDRISRASFRYSGIRDEFRAKGVFLRFYEKLRLVCHTLKLVH